MHENREISCTSWSADQDRSAKAINRKADANVQEKSDCAVVPVNQPNNEGQLSAEAGEGMVVPTATVRTRRIVVGSEEARLRAGLRPPPKLHVRFSRMQLSRRHVT